MDGSPPFQQTRQPPLLAPVQSEKELMIKLFIQTLEVFLADWIIHWTTGQQLQALLGIKIATGHPVSCIGGHMDARVEIKAMLLTVMSVMLTYTHMGAISCFIQIVIW